MLDTTLYPFRIIEWKRGLGFFIFLDFQLSGNWTWKESSVNVSFPWNIPFHLYIIYYYLFWVSYVMHFPCKIIIELWHQILLNIKLYCATVDFLEKLTLFSLNLTVKEQNQIWILSSIDLPTDDEVKRKMRTKSGMHT